ncbi:MAG TPA: glutamate synthase large subunit, partial [Gaiellales bacterium]
QEAIGSMGVDTPLAALSERPQLLSAYFKQHFAQVTNPAIDPQRETLVMSLRTSVGSQGNLLDESPEHARRVAMTQPVLLPGDLEKLRALPPDRFRIGTLACHFDASAGAEGLERALDQLCKQASRLVRTQHTILVLSDRGSDETRCPIPILLATAAVHSHLVREGSRTKCGLIIESAEPREVMHFALLIGYGAAAISPYLAFDSIAALQAAGDLGELSVAEAQERYVKAIGKGLLKVLSKMGISTIQSYRGAQIFEAIGLGPSIVARYFTGTRSRVGGIGLDRIAQDAAARQRAAHAGSGLDAGGLYQYRVEGEHHVWNPEAISRLQRAVRDESYESYQAFSESVDAVSAQATTLRSLLELVPAGPPIDLAEVEPSREIVKRFASGAMSLGSISNEAHETLAIAMNRLGARSNTGEGGEDPARSIREPNGDLRRSAIKQIASARFGVTTGYLTDADQLQIKVSQGAKPGEGGQLPGGKVNDLIARLRHSTPGVGLISPPPHHDIYSIEDLAQLIYDLRTVNPQAEISVKLVSEAGVGTVAAGVAKAKSDHIVIAGHDGGTGASPASSLKHAGLPWELGIAETQQVLVANDLRGRVRLQVDGALRTGRDVLVAALLGAEEYAFSTAPLIAAGCIMMRVCHLNTCPVGIATQDPELRRRFTGTPEQIVTYFLYVAEELRELLASLGLRTLDEAIGRTDLLRQRGGEPLDLSSLLAAATGPDGALTRGLETGRHEVDARVDRMLLDSAAPAIERGEPVELVAAIANTDRAIGTFLSGEIARRSGREGLEPGTISVRLRGTAGQSFGAFAIRGLALELEGQTNDYVGKGLSGATLSVRPYGNAAYDPATSVIIGNTALYGATSGEAFFAGRAGERFSVRNSGANAVVEGVGDHGCEYMTGGAVVVLGPIGRNFAAGMSGGVAYLWDRDGMASRRVNTDLVALEPVVDDTQLRELVERHHALTGSTVAAGLLDGWKDALGSFVLVMPNDMRRILAERDPDLALQEATR